LWRLRADRLQAVDDDPEIAGAAFALDHDREAVERRGDRKLCLQPLSPPATALSMAASQRLSEVLDFAISAAFLILLMFIAVALSVLLTDRRNGIPLYKDCQRIFIEG
jgi:hypothetical protein